MSYVLGIDGGTESLRACLFDLEGNLVRHEARAYTTTHPRTAWAEQNPSDWLSCLGEAVRAVCQNVDPEAIKALSIDTTCCTVVVLDGNAQPLRPAILWMDMRAAQQARAVSNVDDSALRVNGAGTGQVSAEWMIPKALWLKENEPHVYGAAKTICEYQDYMNFYLTGRMCASINNVSIRWWVLTSTDVRSLFARPDSLSDSRFALRSFARHYDAERGWPVDLVTKLGIADILDKWPTDVLKTGEIVGGLSPQAAADLGLPEGLPVSQAGADAFIGMLGLGVIRPGQMALLTGSSHLHLGCVADMFESPGVWGTYRDAVIDGVHVVEGGESISLLRARLSPLARSRARSLTRHVFRSLARPDEYGKHSGVAAAHSR